MRIYRSGSTQRRIGFNKGYLTGYLKFALQNQIKPELIKDCIRTTIYEPFKTRDISNEGKEAFLQFVDERWEKAENKENTERCIFPANTDIHLEIWNPI